MMSVTSRLTTERLSAWQEVAAIIHCYTDLVGRDDQVGKVIAAVVTAVEEDGDIPLALALSFSCFAQRRDVLQRVLHATGHPTPSVNPADSPLARALLACDAALCASFSDELFSLPVVALRCERLRQTEDARGPE